MGRVPHSDDTHLTLDLALRVGEVLLSSGAGAADVTATMLSITSACGLRNVEVDVTFTALSLSSQTAPGKPAQTHMRQLRFRATDYTKLTDVDLLVRALIAGEVDREEARSRLAGLVSSGHHRPRWAVSVAWGLMGVGASIVIGGDWIVNVIAFVVAVAIDVMLKAMSKRRVPPFYQQVAGGLLATVVAVAVFAVGIHVHPSVVVTAGIIMLLSGIAFVGAIQDALSGFYVTAGARGLEALMLTGGVIAGVSGGLNLAARLGVSVTFAPAVYGWSQLPLVLAGAGLTASAYAFASYAPIRALVPIALVGVLGELAYRTMVNQHFGNAWASAVAAVVIGLVSYSVQGRVRVPSLVVVVSGIVPLLPGLSIYRGLFLLAEGSTAGLISLGAALAIAVALAAGVILGGYVAQPLKREAHRLENRLAGPRLVGPLKTRSPRSRRRRSRRRTHGRGDVSADI